jgi:hypothetical protein
MDHFSGCESMREAGVTTTLVTINQVSSVDESANVKNFFHRYVQEVSLTLSATSKPVATKTRESYLIRTQTKLNNREL